MLITLVVTHGTSWWVDVSDVGGGGWGMVGVGQRQTQAEVTLRPPLRSDVQTAQCPGTPGPRELGQGPVLKCWLHPCYRPPLALAYPHPGAQLRFTPLCPGAGVEAGGAWERGWGHPSESGLVLVGAWWGGSTMPAPAVGHRPHVDFGACL